MRFQGLSASALSLLPALPDFNAQQFERVKDMISSGLRIPGLALMAEVASLLALDLNVDPRGSVSPMHNDLRFAKAGTPRYKDHLLLSAWTGANKKAAATMHLRIESTSTGFASGYPIGPESRERWRNAVASRAGASLAKSLEALRGSHEKFGFDIHGEALTRVPKPWPANHPRADLLRMTCFQVRFRAPSPRTITTAGYASWCSERLAVLAPVHKWLARELGESN